MAAIGRCIRLSLSDEKNEVNFNNKKRFIKLFKENLQLCDLVTVNYFRMAIIKV